MREPYFGARMKIRANRKLGKGKKVFLKKFHNKRETNKMPRRFGPKTATHPSIGKECSACSIPFKVGDFTTLIPLGPGNDKEARDKATQGKPYNAVAVEVHYKCAGL